MLFASNVFLFLFLPVTLLGYQLAGRFGARAVFGWLSLASLFFYGYWNPRYLLLLLGSIALNFIASRLIAAARTEGGKTAWLIAAVTANLLLLTWFKYLFPLLHFFRAVGWTGRSFGGVLLPLGISFFTFTQIAYLIDLRQAESEPQDALSYLLFVTFFPHLIAGPIIHHAEMMPQFRAERHDGLRAEDLAVGTTWFLLGLAKKVLIADRFGPVADGLYAQPRAFGAHAAWVGVLCYAIQLYFDFSGYSDMALGLARMFSITFPFNFDSPYKATSIIDFWQRWHITLTRYINLYLYNPLALTMARRRMAVGKKATRKAQQTPDGFLQLIALPMLVTMFLAGLWHGAGLQFIAFGLAHGFYLTVNHLWRTFVPRESGWQQLVPAPLGLALTFGSVLVAQVFFRAAHFRDALWVLGSLGGAHRGAGLSALAHGLPTRANFVARASHAWPEILLVLAACLLLPNTQEILGQALPDKHRQPALLLGGLRWRPNLLWTLGIFGLTTVTLIMLYGSTSFLYFQF